MEPVEATVIDVLVILMAVVVLAVVVTARRTTAARKESGRGSLLAALAPVVDGSVSGDGELTGRYGGRDVQATLRTADPSAPGMPGPQSERYSVEVLRLRLLGVPGGQPWSVWRAITLGGTTWHFARPDGPDALPLVGRLGRLTGVPQADPDLPDRLRAAGILDAFERLGPPTNDSFPRVRFTPDLRLRIAEWLRATGRELPPSALEHEPSGGSWLEVEVERADDSDPPPDRFAALLDVAIGIAEINERANPQDSTSG